jgi:hypothetical protein
MSICLSVFGGGSWLARGAIRGKTQPGASWGCEGGAMGGVGPEAVEATGAGGRGTEGGGVGGGFVTAEDPSPNIPITLGTAV